MMRHLVLPIGVAAAAGVASWLLERGSRRGLRCRALATPPYKTLLRCAAFAKLAYVDPKGFKAASVDVCGAQGLELLNLPPSSEVRFYDSKAIDPACNEDTQAYMWVCPQEKTAFVVFRGTSSRADMLADLQVTTMPWESEVSDAGTAGAVTASPGKAGKARKARVHRGFYEQFKAVSKKLDKDVAGCMQGIEKLVCTGHSLGAALATIAALHYAEQYTDVAVSCYTFGSPRVGNREFTQLFEEDVDEHWRIFNRRDPVPMVPVGSNFQHVLGCGLCCDADKDDQTADFELRQFDLHLLPSRLFNMAMNMRKSRDVAADHDMGKYIRKLEANAFKEAGSALKAVA